MSTRGDNRTKITQQQLNEKRDAENKEIREKQEQFDKEHGTQAAKVRETGSGKFKQGNKVVQHTPAGDPNNFTTSQPNEFGGTDFVQHQRETLHFQDRLEGERIRSTATERTLNANSRAKLISRPNEHAEFLQSGSRESQAIVEFFNQYKSTERPSKTVIIGFLADKGIVPSEKGIAFIDFVTKNRGKLSDFGTSTFHDPKTGQTFSARTGEGDKELARKLGFQVAEQSPSLPAGNNQPIVNESRPPDVQALEDFFGSYKSTTRPPRAILEGVVEERGLEISPQGQDIINEVSANRGRLSDIDTSKFFDPQTNTSFDSQSNSGDQNLAFRIGKRDAPPTPDPLGVSQGLQSGLDLLSGKAKESREVLNNPNATVQERSKATIENFEAEFGTTFLNIPANFVNLGGNIASAQKGKTPQNQVNIPSESTEDIFFRRSFESPDVATGIKNIPSNLRASIDESIKEKGVVGTLGSITATGVTLAPLALAAKPLVPLRSASFPIKTIEGTTRQSQVLVASIGERTKPLLTRTITKTQGINPKTISKQTTRGFDVTSIDLKAASEIGATRAKGGAELAVLGRTEEKILSNPKNLNKLVQSGDISPAQKESVLATKTIVKETKNVPDKPFRKDFSDQPFENIARGKETDALKDFFREKGIVLEGSAIDIPTFLPKFASRAGDFDVKLGSFAQAQDFSKDLASRLNIAARGTDRSFDASKGKLNLIVGGKPDKTRPLFDNLKQGELLHGSSESNIDDIVNIGVDISKSKRGEGFFTTSRRNLAGKFAQRASRENQEQSAFAKITLDESKVLDISSLSLKEQKQIVSSNWLTFQRNAIEAAHQRGFKAVRKVYGSTDPTRKRTETIILDESVIKSVTPIKPSGFKITGGKQVGKAGEFLSADDPDSVGQLSKTGRVFGVKTSTATPKTEGIKRKTLQFQLGRRGASVTSLFEGKFQPPINPAGQGTTRGKDIARFYAGSKTAAEIFKEQGQLAKASRISQQAEIFKRANKDIFDVDDFFASRQKLTNTFAQETKPKNNLASSTFASVKQQSPIGSSVSRLNQSGISSLISGKSNLSILSNPRSKTSSSSLASLVSGRPSVISRSSSSSKSGSSKSGTSKSGTSKSGSAKSVSALSSLFSSKSGVSGSPSSLSSLVGSPTSGSKSGLTNSIVTAPPPKNPVLAILKPSRSKKRKSSLREGATQTKIFAVKNPFSDAFSIKGRKGGTIERF